MLSVFPKTISIIPSIVFISSTSLKSYDDSSKFNSLNDNKTICQTHFSELKSLFGPGYLTD